MVNTTLPTRRAVADIVFAYRQILGRGGHPISLRDFAAMLNEFLARHNAGVSHQTIKNWEDRVHLPRTYYMIYLALDAPNDWRRDFAEDVLSALRPKLYEPATEIGRRALERSLVDTGPQKRRYDNHYIQL